MNARLMAASAIGGFALAALVFSGQFSGQVSAQSAAAKRANGLFSTLRVGQMVEFTTDGWGMTIKTYDDEEFKFAMRHKIKELGEDFVVVETETATGALEQWRLPVYRFSNVYHLGKADPSKVAGGNPPSATSDATSDGKKPAAGGDKKPGTTKKKP